MYKLPYRSPFEEATVVPLHKCCIALKLLIVRPGNGIVAVTPQSIPDIGCIGFTEGFRPQAFCDGAGALVFRSFHFHIQNMAPEFLWYVRIKAIIIFPGSLSCLCYTHSTQIAKLSFQKALKYTYPFRYLLLYSRQPAETFGMTRCNLRQHDHQ